VYSNRDFSKPIKDKECIFQGYWIGFIICKKIPCTRKIKNDSAKNKAQRRNYGLYCRRASYHLARWESRLARWDSNLERWDFCKKQTTVFNWKVSSKDTHTYANSLLYWHFPHRLFKHFHQCLDLRFKKKVSVQLLHLRCKYWVHLRFMQSQCCNDMIRATTEMQVFYHFHLSFFIFKLQLAPFWIGVLNKSLENQMFL